MKIEIDKDLVESLMCKCFKDIEYHKWKHALMIEYIKAVAIKTALEHGKNILKNLK